jgi:hypothetical protein
VADTLVKPVEAVPSTAAVGNGPAQQTTQLVQRGVVRPLSARPTTRIHTAKPFLPEQPGIETELAEVRKAWRVYRGTNSRDAVYIYLSKVFQVVTRWRRLNCAVKNSRAALRLQHDAPQMKPEPLRRDLLHIRSRGRRRQDPQQMVSRVAIRPKSKTRGSAPD